MGCIKKHDNNDADKIVKKEKALKTGYKKQFKRKCHVCGKVGHKGADCWTLEENKEKRPSSYHGKENAETKIDCFTGNRHYCYKKGHQEAECHIKQRDNANNVEEEHALTMT